MNVFVSPRLYTTKDIVAADEEWRSEEKLTSELRKKAMLLPKDDIELLSRYQTTLDNQLIKVLREFREHQAWRIKTLELEATDVDDSKQGSHLTANGSRKRPIVQWLRAWTVFEVTLCSAELRSFVCTGYRWVNPFLPGLPGGIRMVLMRTIDRYCFDFVSCV